MATTSRVPSTRSHARRDALTANGCRARWPARRGRGRLASGRRGGHRVLPQIGPAATKTAWKTLATRSYSCARVSAPVDRVLGVMCVNRTAPSWRRASEDLPERVRPGGRARAGCTVPRSYGCRQVQMSTAWAPCSRGTSTLSSAARDAAASRAGPAAVHRQRLAGLQPGQRGPPEGVDVAPDLAVGLAEGQAAIVVGRRGQQPGAQVEPVDQPGREVAWTPCRCLLRDWWRGRCGRRLRRMSRRRGRQPSSGTTASMSTCCLRGHSASADRVARRNASACAFEVRPSW